jgi:hypothetical protein
MSNTPNPNRKPAQKTTPVIEMFKLYRDDDGHVLLKHGTIHADDYERMREAHPELALPEVQAIPFA